MQERKTEIDGNQQELYEGKREIFFDLTEKKNYRYK